MNIPYVFKKCNKCGKWLVANTYNFYKNKSSKWGLRSMCKKCNKKHSKNYYENNKEDYKKRSKRWYENNKEHDNKRNKQWRENNKEHCKEKKRQWRENNKEKVFNDCIKRRSKEENQGRGITKEQWKEMFDFFNFRCAYSNEYIGGNSKQRSIDHILALDNGGLNEPWNLVPMYFSYNSSKCKRVDVLNWYKQKEYYSEDRLNKIVEWQIYAYNKWGGEEFGELILITDLFEEK